MCGGKVNPWLVIAIGTVVAFIASGVRMVYGVFAVPLEETFHVTRSEVMWPFSLSMIVWGVTQPFTGAFMDSYGPRKAILVCLILSALGFVTAAGAQSMWQLSLGYGLLVGGSYSGLAVAALSLLVSRWFAQQRGRALGIILAGMPLGQLAFSPLAGVLITGWGWRGAFLALAAITLAAFPLAWTFLREPGHITVGSPSTIDRKNLLFGREVRQALRTRPYWMLLVAYFGCGFSGLLIIAHLPSMALEHGFSLSEGAAALGFVGAGGAIGSILGGWVSDRVGRYRALALGYLLRGVGLFLLALPISNLSSFYLFSLVAGAPMFFTIAITQLVIYEIYGIRIAGQMIGLTFLLHQVGSTIGPYFGGWTYENTGGYVLALVIAGGVLINSALWAWRLQVPALRYIADRGVT